jgi:hypothetical protein
LTLLTATKLAVLILNESAIQLTDLMKRLLQWSRRIIGCEL